MQTSFSSTTINKTNGYLNYIFIDKKPYNVGTDPLSRNIQKLVFSADFWAPRGGPD